MKTRKSAAFVKWVDDVVSGGFTGTLKLWKISTGLCLAKLKTYCVPINCVCLTHQFIVSGRINHTIQILNPYIKEVIYTLFDFPTAIWNLSVIFIKHFACYDKRTDLN